MTPLELLRSQYASKQAALQTLTNACTTDGVTRDFTPDEANQWDSLLTEANALKGRITAAEDAEIPVVAPEGRGRRSQPIEAPAIHTKEQRYSFLRALQLSLEKKGFDGIEGEVHAELLKKRSPDSEPPLGILIPLGIEPEFRTLLFGKGAERRDLTTLTGQGAVFTQVELPFIELLRNRTIIKELGATFLTGLNGKVGIPRQNGASTAYWVTEGVPVSLSNPTLDQVLLSDKTLGAASTISRKMLYQSSIDAEQFVKNDLAEVLAIAIDAAAFNGSGSGATPLGICQNPAIQALSAGIQGGPNGAVPTWSQIVNAESQLSANNADRGSLKYAMTPSMRGALKTTQKFPGSNSAVTLWENGEVNGYAALASNNVPSGLTKGTSTNCNAIVFANWRDLIIGQWGGIDTVVNPYTGQLAGAVIISMMMETDIVQRHNESFATILDAKTS